MIDLYGVLQEQETINGELGLGVDYYKGEKGDTPIKGVDYLTPDDVKEISDKVLEQVEAGTKGEDGKSAYQIALDEGFEGSEADWLASLKGTDGRNGIDGINGTNGKDGKTPVKGVDYFTTAEINEIEEGAAAKVDLSNYAKTADLSTVATSGSYNDLSDKPSIPEPYELPVASATALGGVKVGSGLSITNGVLSATGGGTADSVDWSKIQNKPNFANVATSGDYNDLSNKPTIPSVEGLASEAYVNEKVAAIVIPEVPTKVSELENDKGYLTEHQSLEGYAKTAELAQVAKTGSYNDLSDKPTIPSTAGLASTKYVDDKVAGIVIPEVPTKVSAFENDKGYLTEHQSLAEYALKSEIPSTTNLATKAEVQEVENKIPAPYTLPTASTSTLGGVKVDGSTITIADGVISAKGGSGGAEPSAYIKDASVSGNTLTLTKKDDTEVVFTPSGGSSSGGDIIRKTLSSTDRNDIPDWIPDWCANPSKYAVWIDDKNLVFATYKFNMPASNTYSFKLYWMEGNQSCCSGNFNFTDSSFTTIKEKTYFSTDSILLTSSSYQTYISSWMLAESMYDNNLYNAKELAILFKNSTGKMFSYYYNFTKSFESMWDSGSLGEKYSNMNFSIQVDDNTYFQWYYDGNTLHLDSDSISNYRIYYKT